MLCLALFVGLALAGSVRSECGEPVFKSDAESRVTADFSSVSRRGRKNYDYKKIEIEYQPFQMVEDGKCIDESQLNIEVKYGNGEWGAIDASPKALGGGKYKWVVDAVPCKDHFIKFWVFTADGYSASHELSQPISAVSEDDLIRSKTTPNAVTNLGAKNAGDNTLEVYWDPSECATSYEVSYGEQYKVVKAAEGSQILLEDLESCAQYDIKVYAIIGEDEYSDSAAETTFTTQPEVASALQFEPQVESDTDSVTAKWKAFDKLSCVDKYAVSVCKEGSDCQNEEEVMTNNALDFLSYSASDLEQCTAYTLQIQPLYPDMELDPKIVEFRTKSPSAEGAEASLGPVSASAGEGQMISVSWSPVQCAEFYEVYQQVNTGGDWELVHTTEDSSEVSATLAGVPCTEYRYGVAVTIDGVRSKINEADTPLMTPLESDTAFQAPNLEVMATENGVQLSWDHGACIPSYQVRVCPTTGDCVENTVIRDSTVHNITEEFENLDACSDYTVEIFPQIEGEEFGSEMKSFKTLVPSPTPPQGFTAEYRAQNEVEFKWEGVECSSGYEVVQGEDNEVVWETTDSRQLFHHLENLEPCLSYSYGIRTVMPDGERSEVTDMQVISVPPSFKVDPSIKVMETINDTVTFKFEHAESNAKCQVEYIKVEYSSAGPEGGKGEDTVFPQTLDEELIVQFAGASGPGLNLQGKVKYEGFEQESEWITSTHIQETFDPITSLVTSGTASSSMNNLILLIFIALFTLIMV